MGRRSPADGPPDDRLASAARQLRERAEAIAARIPSMLAPSADPHAAEASKKLLHELQVHQIELEMQNDELHRTRAELEASRARYFDLYDLAPVGYLTTTDEGVIVEGNLTAAELLGVTRAAMSQQNLSRYIVPGDQDAYYLHRRALATSGGPHALELRLIRRGATPFWARLEANRAIARDGATTFRVVITDVAERKAAETRLRQASAMFESAREGVMVTDADARVLMVNKAFCERTGYAEPDVVGQTPRILRSGRHDAAFYTAMWAAIAANGTWQGELWNRRKSGEVYPERVSITSVCDDRGRVTHYVGVFSDLGRA
jgi:PAS domain S-box-containing protein